VSASGETYLNTPQALKLSVSGTMAKLWAIDTATPDLESYTDAIALEGPAQNSPANEFDAPVNPGTGRAYDLTFVWERYSDSDITEMQVQIATDSDFDAIVYDNTFTGIASDTIAKVIGPTGGTNQQAEFMPGLTYYWRVRIEQPMYSPWSATRSFTVKPATIFGVASPESGAVGVELMPSLVWAPIEGAIEYFVVVSTDPDFETILMSSTTENTFYTTEKALEYSTTYYWRVRPTPEGPWANGVFTTMAKPVKEEPVVITQPSTPAPPEVVKVEVPTVIPTPIPSALLWAVIIIGAVLVIALIILIVRTRRIS
jgi:hypothetical protein